MGREGSGWGWGGGGGGVRVGRGLACATGMVKTETSWSSLSLSSTCSSRSIVHSGRPPSMGLLSRVLTCACALVRGLQDCT